MNQAELIEKLADIEHQRWADWQKYLHSRGIVDKRVGEGYLCIPMGLVKHWERQINTSYKNLTEKEKNSDREQVKRYWPLILRWHKRRVKEIWKEILDWAEQGKLSAYPKNQQGVGEGGK